MTLEETLEQLTVDKLKARIKLVRGKPSGTRKAELVAFLSASIERHLDDIVARLQSLERAAIAHVVHDGWETLDRSRFDLIHGARPEWLAARNIWSGSLDTDPKRPDLIFYDWRIPVDLHERLRALVEPVPPTSIAYLDEPPEGKLMEVLHMSDGTRDEYFWTYLRYEGEQLAPREVAGALALAQAGKLRQTKKTGAPTARSQRVMSEALVTPDFFAQESDWQDWEEYSWLEHKDLDVGGVRAFALQTLLTAGGFVEASGAKSRLTKRGERLLAAPDHERIASLWSTWLAQDDFDELSRVDQIKGQANKSARLTPPSRRRGAFVDALAELSPGQWIDIDAFTRHMRIATRMPTMAHNLEPLYVDHRGYGSLIMNQGQWVLEEVYLRVLLFEYMATLGLIDVLYLTPEKEHEIWGRFWWEHVAFLTIYDGIRAFRLTALGAWVLGITDDYSPDTRDAEQQLEVLEDATVVVPEQQLGVAGPMLELYARVSGENTWKLTRKSLLGAASKGHALDALRAFLSRHGADELPSTVTRLLEEAERRSAMVSRGADAILFTVGDPATALEIARDAKMKKTCMLVGEDTLVVKASDEERFLRLLLARGWAVA